MAEREIYKNIYFDKASRKDFNYLIDAISLPARGGLTGKLLIALNQDSIISNGFLS